jgi:peptidoglycan hydrolase-like protein with peptidoglycan-binding domain
VTVASTFVSWQRGREPGAPFDGPSPNLQKLAAYMNERWKVKSLGIYSRRPVRGGTAWSTHAFGAAVDLGYDPKRHGGPGLAVVETEILPWLISNSAELGIQRIHLYQRTRYWEAGRGWIERSPGHGNDWIHVETHPNAWGNNEAIPSRLSEPSKTPFDSLQPVTPPRYPGRPLKRGSTGQAVTAIQGKLGQVVDGKFGPQTETAVKAFQIAQKLTVDGIVGPNTWSRLFG